MLQLYQAALLEWAEAVGPENVVTETASLRAAEKGTFATGHTIPAIVRPGDRQEVQEYPWRETQGQTPLEGGQMARFRKELRIGVWNGSGALYGTKAQVKEARRLLRKASRTGLPTALCGRPGIAAAARSPSEHRHDVRHG
jgi:hypothetical protein